MFPLLTQRLLSPDSDPAADLAGAVTPPSTAAKTPPPTPPANTDPSGRGEGSGASMDLSQKVVLADGTTVTVGDLVKQAGAAKTLEQMTKDQAAVFDETIPVPQRAESIRRILTNLGHDKDTIDQYLAASGLTTDPAGGGSEVDPREVRLKSLEAEQERLRVQTIKKEFTTSLNNTLDNHKAVKLLLDKVGKRLGASATAADKEKAVAKAKDTLRSMVNREALDELHARRAKNNGTFQLEWIDEEVGKAADAVISKYQSVIGDINQLGGAPETATGQNADILTKAPKPPPKFDPKKTVGDLDTMITDFTTDSLLRGAAEAEQRQTAVL